MGRGGSIGSTGGLLNTPSGSGDGGDGIDARVTANNCPVTIDCLGTISGGSGAGGNLIVKSSGVASATGGGGVPLGGAHIGQSRQATLTTPGSYQNSTGGYAGAGGGQYAQPGQNGVATLSTRSASNGGVAGACVRGNSNVTWINTGTRYGTLIS